MLELLMSGVLNTSLMNTVASQQGLGVLNTKSVGIVLS